MRGQLFARRTFVLSGQAVEAKGIYQNAAPAMTDNPPPVKPQLCLGLVHEHQEYLPRQIAAPKPCEDQPLGPAKRSATVKRPLEPSTSTISASAARPFSKSFACHRLNEPVSANLTASPKACRVCAFRAGMSTSFRATAHRQRPFLHGFCAASVISACCSATTGAVFPM